MNSLNSEHEKAHGANWRKWIGHLKDTPALGLELGTWRGESAEWMLENIFTHPESHYTCADTFEGSVEHHLAGIDCSQLEQETRARLAPFGNRVLIEVGRSDAVLRWLKTNLDVKPFDFIYVDAAHDALNVLRDAVLAFDLLAEGGVMVFDDFGWEVMPSELDRPKIAVEAFVSCYGKQLQVIGMGWQLAVKRK